MHTPIEVVDMSQRELTDICPGPVLVSPITLHITSVQWGVVWRGDIVEEGGLVVGVDVGPLSTMEKELHF